MKPSLLDTDTLSYFLQKVPTVVRNADTYIDQHRYLIFSEITYFEILAGLAYKSAEKQRQEFEELATRCHILKLTFASIRESAEIYGDLRRKGIQIGTPDLLIAGLAIENELVLATNNEKHYQSIEKLQVVNWNK